MSKPRVRAGETVLTSSVDADADADASQRRCRRCKKAGEINVATRD